MDDDASCDAVAMIPDTPPAALVITSERLLRELLAGQQGMKGTLKKKLMDDDASCDAVAMIPDTPPAALVSTSESLLRELLAGQQGMKGTLDDVSLKIAAITLDLTNVKQKLRA